MITGDHIDTAVAIGKDLKIIKGADEALEGAQLEKLTDIELIEVKSIQDAIEKLEKLK